MFEEELSLMVERLWTWRQNLAASQRQTARQCLRRGHRLPRFSRTGPLPDAFSGDGLRVGPAGTRTASSSGLFFRMRSGVCGQTPIRDPRKVTSTSMKSVGASRPF